MDRASFTLLHPLRVRWAEVDRQDVVFNAHYLLYFDVAVAEHWRAMGFDYPRALVENGTDVFGDQHLTSGELVYVHTDLRTRRSTPLPPALREAIVRYERTPPG